MYESMSGKYEKVYFLVIKTRIHIVSNKIF